MQAGKERERKNKGETEIQKKRDFARLAEIAKNGTGRCSEESERKLQKMR